VKNKTITSIFPRIVPVQKKNIIDIEEKKGGKKKRKGGRFDAMAI